MHSTYLKYTEYDAFTVNETYAMLKEFFFKNATMDPYLGPHLNVKEFENLMLSSQMLIEADNDKDKEQHFCEEAFGWYVCPLSVILSSSIMLPLRAYDVVT